MVALQFKTLPRGGRLLEVRVKTGLSRYELVAAAIHAKQSGETEITRDSVLLYLRRMLLDSGLNGFGTIYDDATVQDRMTANTQVSQLFPEMAR